ncbi:MULTISPECIES: DUF3164 family protein [unclassified Burkholderia]|uniref:DUF3164 family protein n=1 Tax=unclassified Burkholderia TaxID=2613784 RepID=UPI0007573530|nr:MULTISPECIES: DUF3164 family protein [unclassified Burkholderia]KUY80118.1 sulfate transporter [Burkholderia sp. RF4-BP95]KUY96158.1 sulfate transporter [Burkholderia sp. RF7-non_BP1]KUY98550.1 sulfate transporter [Burkholderia sp. RF7-non_BP4]
MTNQAIPAGYVQDARGRLVPASLVAPIDQLRDQTVTSLVADAKRLQSELAEFKARAFGDIAAFVEASHEQYGVKVGGAKGNISLITFDGRYKIVRQIAERIQFDERLQAAKELIDECLREWTEGSNDKIKVLINEAFQVDKEGNVNTGRILALRRLAIDDPKWTKAMRAIVDSIRVTGSKPYIRLYERVEDTEEYRAISLDLAAI